MATFTILIFKTAIKRSLGYYYIIIITLITFSSEKQPESCIMI